MSDFDAVEAKVAYPQADPGWCPPRFDPTGEWPIGPARRPYSVTFTNRGTGEITRLYMFGGLDNVRAFAQRTVERSRNVGTNLSVALAIGVPEGEGEWSWEPL